MLRCGIVAVATLVALAACFSKPAPPGETGDGGVTSSDGGQPADDGGGIDSLDAGLSPRCSTYDEFDGGGVCTPWGTTTGSGSAVELGNHLELSPLSSTGSTGCVSSTLLGFSSVTAKVTSVLAVTGDVTTEIMMRTQAGRFGAAVTRNAANTGFDIVVSCGGAVDSFPIPFDVATTPYIHLLRDDDQLRVQTLSGTVSSPVGTCNTPPGALDSVQVEVVVTRSSVSTMVPAGVARFDALEICP